MDKKLLQLTSDAFVSLLKEKYGEQINWLDITSQPEESFKAEGIFLLSVDIETFIAGKALQLIPHANKFHLIRLLAPLSQLRNSNDVLQKIKTYLTTGGLVSLSIPDDVESYPSHPFSYWISAVENAGYHCFIRRSVGEWKLLLYSQPPENWAEFQHKFLADYSAVIKEITLTGERFYFELKDESSAIFHFYLLNPHAYPCQITLECLTAIETHPDFFLGDLKLHFISSLKDETGYRHCWESVPIAPGGHIFTIRYPDQIDHLSIRCGSLDTPAFLKRLPFDHYQRYQLISAIINQIFSHPGSVLDMGGSLGYLSLFLPNHAVTVLDVVSEDSPCAQVYDGQCIPFDDDAFDVVVSIDTLEHIPAAMREHFLSEMVRVSRTIVIVCCPFQETYVAEAEKIVQNFLTVYLQKSDHFLDEHQLYGLPSRENVRNYLLRQTMPCYEIPNGFLPRWTGMQLASFTLSLYPEMADGLRQFNTVYNNQPQRDDNKEPSYRYALVAKKGDFTDAEQLVLESMLPSSSMEQTGMPWDLASLIVAVSNSRLIQEKDAILLKYADRINNLLRHCNNLESAQKENIQEKDKLLLHAENLRKQNERFSSLFENQQQDAKNYAALNLELQKNSTELLKQKETLLQNNTDLLRHSENLHELLLNQQTTNETQAESIKNQNGLLVSMQQHAANLQHLLDEKETHIHNLENILTERNKHTHNLETILQGKEKHIQNLEAHTKNLETLLTDNQQRHIQNEIAMQEKFTHLGEMLETNHRSHECINQYIKHIFENRNQPDFAMQSLNAVLSNETDPLVISVRDAFIAILLENKQLQDRVQCLHESFMIRLLMKLRLAPGNREK